MEKIILGVDEAKDKEANELFRELASSEKGLSGREAEERLKLYGHNEITEKKRNPLLKFLGYFWGPIAWMIEAAAVMSAVIDRWDDFGIIMALLVLNAVVGFWQENKADNAIEMLKKRLAPEARILRDGKWGVGPSEELVPGDVVRVRLGDIIPADLKFIEGDYASIDQAALTGESLPVDKKEGDIGYSGSVVRQGEMNALVIATGMNTYFGKTAKLVEEAKTISHFQKAVIKIGDYLIATAIIVVTIIVVVQLLRHEGVGITIQYALVLTVAAIPAALPAVLSVTMAAGATALAKKKAIVSRLVAIEEMAGMDILCCDKTGTITKSELTVAEIEPFGDFSANDVMLYSALGSREEDRDPIDLAVLAREQSIEELKATTDEYRTTEFKPFDPIVKHTESTVEDKCGNRFKVAKGAPQVILDLSVEKEEIREDVEGAVHEFGAKGYRALGVARTRGNGEEDWQFAGLLFLSDPPREDSAETIKTAKSMGVDVKMVTGDHVDVAREIARRVNLGTDIQPVSAFLDKPDEEAMKIVEEADGFAQVYPEHKFHIVELLQEKGHITGMTGDGVNDAPALKEADAGIAVAGATDAAKSAADIVLTIPGLSVIIDALEQSRMIFQRMTSYSIYRIAETIRVLFFIAIVILVFNVFPITALMIILLALFNDAPIMAIATDNVLYSDEPEKWDMRIVLELATFLGIIGVFFTFGLFFYAESGLKLSTGEIQSLVFLKLAVAGHLTIFLTRTRGPFWSIKPSGALLWSAVVTKLIATLFVVYGWFVTPIGWKMAGYIWAYAIVAFLITDVIKVQLYKLLDHRDIQLHPAK